MTVLSVLRSCTGAGGAVGSSPSNVTITSIRIFALIRPGNAIQLIRPNNGIVSLRHFGSSGKGQTQTGSSGIRVSELTKYPHFREFKITPSRYAWQKYKDMFHFYFMLGFIPLITIVFLVNVFIGPPKLAIPEPGYVPKPWEYQRHPITQFMARYIFPSLQETYERNLFYIKEEEEKRRMRLLAWKAESLMRERGDFYNYYGTKTLHPKYLKQAAEENKRILDGMGDNIDDESAIGLPFDR